VIRRSPFLGCGEIVSCPYLFITHIKPVILAVMTKIKPGVYEHYKGRRRYRVLGLARHSETLEEMVVYQALYADKKFGSGALWVRPAAMFQETVKLDGQPLPRFRFVSDKS